MKIPEPKKLPSGSYNIYLRLGGENVSITRSTAKECIKDAQLIKAEYMSGKRKAVSVSSMTLGEAFERYIESRALLSPSTIRGYESIKNNHFIEAQKRNINKIDWQAEINAEAVERAEKPLSPKTVHNLWAFVSSTLKYFDLPVPHIVLPQKVKNIRPWLDNDEMFTLIDNIKGKPYEGGILLALHSLRRSEVCAIDYEDIYDGVIHVRGAVVMGKDNELVHRVQNKTYTSTRDVPIMIPRLAELAKENTGKVYPFFIGTLAKQIKRECEKAGITAVTTHGLRHTFTSVGFSDEVGMTEQEMMQIGGWKDSHVMHEIYKHIQEKDRVKHLNNMAVLFQNHENEKLSKNVNADENADGV